MAERSLSHVNYGHAGTATFDIDSHKWSFGRQFTSIQFSQVGLKDRIVEGSTEALPSAIRYPSTTVSTRLTDARANLKALLQDHPQLGPASSILPELAAISAAVVSATATYDPLIGSLFSTGSITLETRSDKWQNPRRVAATVTGEAGNILRLTLLYKEILGWGIDKSVWIRAETLRDTESGYWNAEATPIQQVCFAQSDDRSTLLAVRLLSKTVLFRPYYSSRLRPASFSPHYDLPSSTLVAHPILSLENGQSGGSPHADVAFNPDFQLQFAVVDQSQAWSVWDINYGRQDDDYTFSCLVQGRIAPLEDAEASQEDGWARILWVGDVNTILVCNRRQLCIVGIKGSSFTYLPCPTLCSKGTSDWILDVKRHPLLRGRFFVLTSTGLFLMAVTTIDEAVDATAESGAWTLISWRHYRGAEDLTLNMSVHMLREEDDTSVLLHSRMNNLIQTYTFSNLSTDSPSSTNPTLLNLTLNEAYCNLHLIMEPLRFQGDVRPDNPGLGRSYCAQGLQFYKLFALRSDLSVHEMIVHAHPFTGSSATPHQSSVEDLSWSISYRPRKVVQSARAMQDMDDFLDTEGVKTLENPLSRLAPQTPWWMHSRSVGTAQNMADLRLVYDALNQDASGGETSSTTVDVVVVTSRAKELLASTSDLSQLPIGTLIEFAGMALEVPDIDEASSSLNELLTSQDRVGSLEVRRIASNELLHLGDYEPVTMSSLYDSILESWVAPLPTAIGLRTRTRKERLARRIATEVTLASFRFWERQSQVLHAQSTAELPQHNTISMPILPSQPLSGSPAKTTQWQSSPLPPTIPSAHSQSLLLSSQSQPTPSQGPFSLSHSQPSLSTPTLPSTPLTSDDPFTRLGKHLKFKDDAPAPSPMSDTVDQLLAHWQIGTDPQEYDWEAQEQAGYIEMLDEVSQQQREKAAEKARKKKERREKRQRREDEMTRAQPSSQPFVFEKPVVYPRSSPGPILGGIGSSSQVASQLHVPLPLGLDAFGAQSQAEPGKFGGRLDKKKKKKGRVSGF
ncbi:RNA polymerase I-specific transcription initiation factor RRN6-like protein [Phaeosphaeriaceae sp. PMI808]|nr:RNA polymerase I-specific transcription initiation factor RRN6-like protein [Phaeosphaeriaceae sp. PMI808]